MSNHEQAATAAPHEGKSPRASSSRILGCFRLVGFVTVTAWSVLTIALGTRLGKTPEAKLSTQTRGTSKWGRRCCLVLGIRLKVTGTVGQGVLLTPNHMGYADIFAIAAAAPAFFLAKSEVGGWPVIGGVLRVTGHKIVNRKYDRSLTDVADAVANQLRHGQSVCIFLEGTSTDGDEVLPFRPALVQPALDVGANLQPIALKWTAQDHRIHIAEDVAYWKDHVLVPHFWRLMGLRGIEAEVRFLDVIDTENGNRKQLAKLARSEVCRALQLD